MVNIGKFVGAAARRVGHQIGKRVGGMVMGKKGAKMGYNLGGKAGDAVGKMAKPIVAGAAKSVLGSFKKGGHVHRTGHYKLHKGEYVVPNHPTHKQKKTILRKIK
jgi:hypothetical protein